MIFYLFHAICPLILCFSYTFNTSSKKSMSSFSPSFLADSSILKNIFLPVSVCFKFFFKKLCLAQRVCPFSRVALVQTANAPVWIAKNFARAFLPFTHYPIHNLRMRNISLRICLKKFHYQIKL